MDYSPKTNIFEDLDALGIVVPNELRFYPHFIFYDFETYLKPSKKQIKDSKLKYIGTHELLSISLCGSEDTKAIFIPATTSTKEAIQEMLQKINRKEAIRKIYIQKTYKRYVPYFDQLAELDEKIRKRLTRRFVDWIEEVPVYGFNSGKFDMNVIK